MIRSSLLAAAIAVSPLAASAQSVPPATDPRVQEIAGAASAARIEADIRTLAGFGTRNTFSDTLSQTRGIGAARRWIKAEMDRISQACGGCMEVSYVSALQEGGRLPQPVNIVNVVGIIRGTAYPDRYVVMAGDIDSRASNVRCRAPRPIAPLG